MTRHGKIARLAYTTREELNRRIADGLPGDDILAWLNALPEVQAIMASHFAARPINLTNLHAWREGGYREWLLHQEALSHAADLASAGGRLANAAGGQLAEHLATLLASRYALEFSSWSGNDDPALTARLAILRGFSQDIIELRRGEHDAARIRIEETRLERDREKFEADILAYFRRWADFPKIREALTAGSDIPKEGSDPLLGLFLGQNNPNPSPPAQEV